ncbi:MAG: dTMP kinase [Candidatus Yanofskybacteria bacterium RIFCSPLOWO2_01_FULL_42_49]|uniref:Thymidylate kinase n=1 Tax=Candidatus Yanofskybacteria bacterium RIFCSPLOWO2_01_FULL_42_49 TaxID=1802694 RepID=A0A1F8GAX9_9BACT|nr:MAG: dTMP kinase [Candidatus Yanofskybacteria bacterium RIFCSPLOWO2_01_FULL_42_49]
MGVLQNPYRGLFLCGSGIDFCGKSSQVLRICNWLRANLADKNIAVLRTKQPTTQRFGRMIRSILGDKQLFAQTDPFDLQELFAKDSRMHCEMEVIPGLEAGHIVCTDRFRESMVYGAEKGNVIELHMLMEMNQQLHRRYWVWPDKVFIFDVPPELAIERGKASGRSFDEMERLDTLARVRENFYIFAREYPEANLHFIDGSRSIEEIFSDVKSELLKLLNANGIKLS